MQDLSQIKQYRDLEAQIRTQVASGSYDLQLYKLTDKMLSLNPEYCTIWNIRRRCLISSVLSAVTHQHVPDAREQTPDACQQNSDEKVLQSELAFVIPLLKAAPKCYWIWKYRQWILMQAVLRLSMTSSRHIWETELGLTSRLLSKDQRNFHAWSYRRYVIAKLESNELQGQSLAEDEFAYTEKILFSVNLSNFSAWHNRSQLIPKLLEERHADDETRAAFLAKELNIAREGLNVAADDQSLWYYHRFLISQITNPVDSFAPALTTAEKIVLLRHEIAEVKDLLEDYTEVSLVYEGLVDCTLALELVEKGKQSASVKICLSNWLANLRVLDPMRIGRWKDKEAEIEQLLN